MMYLVKLGTTKVLARLKHFNKGKYFWVTDKNINFVTNFKGERVK